SIELPPAIDLSDPAQAAAYQQGVAHTRNGDLAGKPIVYAITILNDAAHRELAEKYVAFLLGPEGQAILKKDGFVQVSPAIAENPQAMPQALQAMVKPWPGK
ncbi:MAG: substrate-binding domain-containing protein, partial [Burkholderiaceae bacterium]